jgi:hypothetical protein
LENIKKLFSSLAKNTQKQLKEQGEKHTSGTTILRAQHHFYEYQFEREKQTCMSALINKTFSFDLIAGKQEPQAFPLPDAEGCSTQVINGTISLAFCSRDAPPSQSSPRTI